MDINELDKIGGKKQEKPTCDPRLPSHYQPRPRSHDGHLGGIEGDYDDYYNESGIKRNYNGFRLDRHIFD